MQSTTSGKVRLLVLGVRNDSRRGPWWCCEASKVLETIPSPPTAISSRCSQTATRRVLARSITLTSLEPSKVTCCCLCWKYWAEARWTLSTAGQVVLCYHAGDLISEVHGLSRQHIRMEMHDPSTCHIVVGGRLLSCMLVELCNGGKPPLTVLDREGKHWSLLTPLGLGLAMLCRPILLKFLIHAGLHAFGP